MNNPHGLRDEFKRLAHDAPSGEEIRHTVSSRTAARAKRRRMTSLIGVAAAVVVIVVGASVTTPLLQHHAAGPSGPDGTSSRDGSSAPNVSSGPDGSNGPDSSSTPPAVVDVPDVPLPSDTQLTRFQLQPVFSPVTASPAAELTHRIWFSDPSALAVLFYNPAKHTDPFGSDFDSSSVTGSSGSAHSGDMADRRVGYVVTDDRHAHLTRGSTDAVARSKISHEKITVGGHAATLDTAPDGTIDEFDIPAARRISWQLGDGRWVHVWASDQADLRPFAATVVENDHALPRALGIGVTVRGMTTISSVNSGPDAQTFAGVLFLCPKGVSPATTGLGSAGSDSAGSDSAGPDSAGPGGSGDTDGLSEDPTTQCVTAMVMAGLSTGPLGAMPASSTVTVGNTTVHVSKERHAARVDLGDGLAAMATAPASAKLSEDDLATLAASIRLSPAVTVSPPPGISAGSSGDSSGADGAGSTPMVSIPSTLPQAPADFSAPNGLVAPDALPSALPFTVPVDGATATWIVGADSAVVHVFQLGTARDTSAGEGTSTSDTSVSLSGYSASWYADGLGRMKIPADATTAQIGGHDAHTWRQDTTNGTVTHVAWKLPDGSGIDVTNVVLPSAPVNEDVDVAAAAAKVTAGPTPLPSTMTPTKVPDGYSDVIMQFSSIPSNVAGMVYDTPGADSSGSGSADADTPATEAPGTSDGADGPVASGGFLCPAGTEPRLDTAARQGCLHLMRGVLAINQHALDDDATVATIDGQSIYVNAAGTAVTRLDDADPGTRILRHPDSVITLAAMDNNVSTADLAGTLASIPR